MPLGLESSSTIPILKSKKEENVNLLSRRYRKNQTRNCSHCLFFHIVFYVRTGMAWNPGTAQNRKTSWKLIWTGMYRYEREQDIRDGGFIYSQISHIIVHISYTLLFFTNCRYMRDSMNRWYWRPAVHCAQDKFIMSGDGDRINYRHASARKLELREHALANSLAKAPTRSRQDLVSGCSTRSVKFSPDSKLPVISTALGLYGAFPTQSPIPSQKVKLSGRP